MTWIRQNIGTVVTIVSIIALLAIQWGAFTRTVALTEDTAAQLRIHEADTTKHIDQFRDERRWDDLQRRLDQIERKLDERR